MAGFTDEQALRYVRQVTVREVGAAGQERLLGSSAVVVGAGGLGRNKADSAAEAARALNPTVEVVPFVDRLAADNALELLSGFDVVLDCTDNFSTRYLVNDAAVILGTPLVTASIMRFYGQLTTVKPRVGPCLRCRARSPAACSCSTRSPSSPMCSSVYETPAGPAQEGSPPEKV